MMILSKKQLQEGIVEIPHEITGENREFYFPLKLVYQEDAETAE